MTTLLRARNLGGLPSHFPTSPYETQGELHLVEEETQARNFLHTTQFIADPTLATAACGMELRQS